MWQNTWRCLGSGCGQWEVEEGEAELYKFFTCWKEVAVRIFFVASLSLQLSETLKPRWGHSITAFFLTDGETEVTLFGGTSDPQAVSDEKQSKLADTTLLQFCKGINTFISLYMCMYGSTVVRMCVS